MTGKVGSTTAVGNRLTSEQVANWRNQGFCLVHNLLPSTLLQTLRDDALARVPEPGTSAAGAIKDFGSGQHFVFPSRSQAANEITLHIDLLQAVADLLGAEVDALRLTQSDVWPKYGRGAVSSGDYDNAEQRIHCDYPNHMLVHPTPWSEPCAVEIIIYLSEGDSGGATAVVPRQGDGDPAYPWPIVRTPGVAGLPYINDRARAEAHLKAHAPETAAFREQHLYPREVLADYRFGSVLFYRHDVWHRGTPVKEGAIRIVQNLTYRLAHADWISTLHPGWSWSMYHPEQHFERLVAEASVVQRTVLGFPSPGSAYWNAQTLEAVAARYAPWEMDLSPYAEAMDSGQSVD